MNDRKLLETIMVNLDEFTSTSSLLKRAIEALETSSDCIQAMTDGPGCAAWGPQLDKNDLVIAEIAQALKARP